jgi:hypothetical protein
MYLETSEETEFEEWVEIFNAQLKEEVEMLKTSFLDIPKRRALSNLLIQNSYQRDVINVLQATSSNKEDFKWQQRPRIYNDE